MVRNTSATPRGLTRYTGSRRRSSCTRVSSLLPESVATTRSGWSATTVSRLGASMLPTRCFRRAAAGKSQKSVTPISRSSAPITNSISVTPGTRETMRRGAAARVTVRPVWSVTVSAATVAAGASASIASATIPARRLMSGRRRRRT